MARPQEIPQLTTELIDMSREYLRQETLEPAKRLGKHAGMGIGGAALLSFGSFLMVLGLYFALRMVFPDRSEEHTSELQPLMRISYAVFCLIKKKTQK